MQEQLKKTNNNIPLWTGDLWVNDGAWGRVGHFAMDVGEEPAGDPLLHHHHTQLGPMTSRWRGSVKNRQFTVLIWALFRFFWYVNSPAQQLTWKKYKEAHIQTRVNFTFDQLLALLVFQHLLFFHSQMRTWMVFNTGEYVVHTFNKLILERAFKDENSGHEKLTSSHAPWTWWSPWSVKPHSWPRCAAGHLPRHLGTQWCAKAGSCWTSDSL